MTIETLLIPKTPAVVSVCLVLMYFCFLYPLLSLCTRMWPTRSFWAGTLAIPTLLIAVGAFGWWVWPHDVAMTYTNTPEFNLYRRFRIQTAADSYSRFLKKIGFNVPVAAPALGIAPGRVQAGPLPEIGTFRMTIAREDLDHPDDDLMAVYGFYFFSQVIHEPSSEGDPSSKQRLGDALWLFANYFRCSFDGKLTDYYDSPSDIEKWNHALWDLRIRYGADTMNKAMFIAAQQWKPSGSIKSDSSFNNYFSQRILAGIATLDANMADPGGEARGFLEKRGLFQPAPK